jgi:hypothetical protein
MENEQLNEEQLDGGSEKYDALKKAINDKISLFKIRQTKEFW